MRSTRWIGAALVCAAMLVACGGGLTHAQYVAKVNAICDKFNKQQKTVAQPTSAADVPAYVDKIVPAFTLEIAEVGAVKPPKADKAKVDQIIADLRAALPQLQKLKTSISQGDQAGFTTASQELDRLNTKVNDEAGAVGLSTCAQS